MLSWSYENYLSEKEIKSGLNVMLKEPDCPIFFKMNIFSPLIL